MALITIIGLAAKDAILIIEFAKDLRAKGTPLMQALRWACDPGGLVIYWAKVRFISEYVHMEMDLLK